MSQFPGFNLSPSSRSARVRVLHVDLEAKHVQCEEIHDSGANRRPVTVQFSDPFAVRRFYDEYRRHMDGSQTSTFERLINNLREELGFQRHRCGLGWELPLGTTRVCWRCDPLFTKHHRKQA